MEPRLGKELREFRFYSIGDFKVGDPNTSLWPKYGYKLYIIKYGLISNFPEKKSNRSVREIPVERVFHFEKDQKLIEVPGVAENSTGSTPLT